MDLYVLVIFITIKFGQLGKNRIICRLLFFIHLISSTSLQDFTLLGHLWDQSCKERISCWRLKQSYPFSLALDNLLSSENNNVNEVTTSGSSLINIKSKTEPKTLPCVTLPITSNQDETLELMRTLQISLSCFEKKTHFQQESAHFIEVFACKYSKLVGLKLRPRFMDT